MKMSDIRPNRDPKGAWVFRATKRGNGVVHDMGNGVVRTEEGERISISVWEEDGVHQSMTVSRRNAHLMADRISKCLEDTTVHTSPREDAKV